ncbi:flavin reductase family protein [candidate division GN15 bacterium]|nr:flavin reductase family protein [candidate division GN15 bacterium]
MTTASKKSLGAKTIAIPTPVWIIGSYDKDNRPNAMAVAWGGICCSKPPAVTISLRKATYTYGSIMERKAFTVSVPSDDHLHEADFFGIASGRDTDKFDVTGLTPTKSDLVDAPYVDEFPLVMECKLLQTVEIGLHTQFIGEIVNVRCNEQALGSNGLPDLSRVRPLVYSPPNGCYFGTDVNFGKAYQVGMGYKKQTEKKDEDA